MTSLLWVLALFATPYLTLAIQTGGVTRTYYVAALDVEWDYAPSGKNLINDDVRTSDVFMTNSRDPPMIGRKYKKAIYREFTDETFTKQVHHPPWLGILGPVIRGEVGDHIIVHFWNNASRNFSMHPHGVFYTKLNEGALYEDGTNMMQKMDDGVPPGAMWSYLWEARPEYGPTGDDPNCLTWAYHSHFMAENDINTGVMGVLIICKPGILDPWGNRKDVDREYVLLFQVMNENLNFYLDDNIETYLPGLDPEKVKNDTMFESSNVMFGINGYIFGNLPTLDMCTGDRVSWHLLGLGSQRDIHSVSFGGQTVVEYKHRKDIINLFPALSTTVLMVANNPGNWLLACRVDFHFMNGMQALFNVDPCGHPVKGLSLNGNVRAHYIAAEEVLWDYAPSGINKLNNVPLEEDEAAAEFFGRSHDRIGGLYKKVIYRGYTDETFKEPLVHPAHLGILGPVIRAEVGDVIKVVFLNRASRPYSMQPARLFVDKANEATNYIDGQMPYGGYGSYANQSSASQVSPGHSHTYVWTVPSSVGPTKDDPHCLTGRYFSTVDPVRDAFSGLVGPLLVCRAGTLDEYGLQRYVDHEYWVNFYVFDENLSHYIGDNARMFLKDVERIDPEDVDFLRSNHMHAINGFMYGNLEGMVMCKSSVVSWHILGLGDDPDVHSAHFHGNTFSVKGTNRDSIWFIPDTYETLIMKPDNVGEWALECRTNLHFQSGMRATYHVKGCGHSKDSQIPITGEVRTYYIAAVEQEWNFAPRDLEIIFGGRLSEDENTMIFVNQNDTWIGRRNKKVLYREFTDETFTTMKKRGPEEKHLSMLGPMIKAEVGDVIRVFFKNMASRNYSMHPHGVFYQKDDEGSPYEDNTSGKKKLDDSVPPGQVYEYVWVVPKRAGPGPNEFNCKTWAYYSAVDPVRDTNSGLMGPLITCRPGILNKDGSRTDIEREFVLLFSIIDENESWYLDENIQRYTLRPDLVDKLDPEFEESNLKRAINGRIFANVYGLDMYLGEKAAWYLIGMGSESDVHTVHLHGQTFLRPVNGFNRHDVIEILPGTFETIEMLASDPGRWFLHCHVNEHSEAGMSVFYNVINPSGQAIGHQQQPQLSPHAVGQIGPQAPVHLPGPLGTYYPTIHPQPHRRPIHHNGYKKPYHSPSNGGYFRVSVNQWLRL